MIRPVERSQPDGTMTFPLTRPRMTRFAAEMLAWLAQRKRRRSRKLPPPPRHGQTLLDYLAEYGKQLPPGKYITTKEGIRADTGLQRFLAWLR